MASEAVGDIRDGAVRRIADFVAKSRVGQGVQDPNRQLPFLCLSFEIIPNAFDHLRPAKHGPGLAKVRGQAEANPWTGVSLRSPPSRSNLGQNVVVALRVRPASEVFFDARKLGVEHAAPGNDK